MSRARSHTNSPLFRYLVGASYVERCIIRREEIRLRSRSWPVLASAPSKCRGLWGLVFVQDVLVHRDQVIQPMRRVRDRLGYARPRRPNGALILRGQIAHILTHIRRQLHVSQLEATISIDEEREDEQDENESAGATADGTNQRHWQALLLRELVVHALTGLTSRW